DDGGFFTVGYELGQVMQDVKNPGKSQANTLTSEMNAGYTNNISASQGANIVGSLSNTFTQYLYSLLGAYSNSAIGSQVKNINQDPDTKFITHMLGNAKGTLPYDILQTSTGANQYDTSYYHTFQQLSYLSSVEYFLQAMNTIFKKQSTNASNLGTDSTTSNSSVFNANYVKFLEEQNNNLYNASNSIMQAILALGQYNTANNTETLTNQEVAKLATEVVDASEQALSILSNNANSLISGKLSSGTSVSDTLNGLNVSSVISARSAGLMTTMLPNARNTLNALIDLVSKVESTPYLPQFRSGNSRQTNIMNGFYTKWGYKQFFGKKRNIGLRYYGFFSYNGANVGFKSTYNTVGLYTYGVGT
ncbi:outer membrane beta-barrel protein, partial [Helicobacter cetorum]|uniref:outer membrane beta-barrel protein n=1 Tax=Helicobacter cetorum TaxID=138563 RepID=UPI000CF0C7C0